MKGHILYMSLRPIKAGEELTIDYNFGETGDASKCKCGARNCRGILESTDESTKKKAAREKKRAAAAKQKKGA